MVISKTSRADILECWAKFYEDLYPDDPILTPNDDSSREEILED